MKILILGSRGNLGTQLAKVFQKDHEVKAWDRNELDVTNKEETYTRIKNLKPDVVINAVAYNAVDLCEDSEEEYAKAKALNAKAVANIADAVLEVGATMIHYSTDYVFAGDDPKGYPENAETMPINHYGMSKMMGERKVIFRVASGMNHYIIRTSKLFGPKGESDLAKPSFFDVMLKLGAEKSEVDVVDAEESCFTYTPDLAHATKELLDNKEEFGIYHIVNSDKCTWYEAVLELFKVAKIETKVNPVSSDKFPRSAARPEYSVLKNTKLKPLRSYKEALKDYLNK